MIGAVLEVARQLPLARLRPQPLVVREKAACEKEEEGRTPAIESLYSVMADPDPDDPLFVAFSLGGPVTLELSGTSGRLQWETVSPTTGETTSGPVSFEGRSGSRVFPPPSDGESWVLVVSRNEQ